jgi:hypothetical protein
LDAGGVFSTSEAADEQDQGMWDEIGALTEVTKFVQEAQRTWWKLDGSMQLELVQAGRRFVDGGPQKGEAA